MSTQRGAGFQAPKRTVRLVFDDGHQLHGLEVSARSVSVGTLLELSRLAAVDFDRMDATAIEGIDRLFAVFAESLVTWNMESDGVPVPCDVGGLRSLDLGTVMLVIMAWMEGLAGVSDPLPGPSGAGPQFPVGSIPTETL